MCGIVGIVGREDVVPALVEGLRRLEYRGYDSAGVAVARDGILVRVRSAGKIAALEQALSREPLHGACGIAHTRWATHGRPTDANAHPHVACRGDIALVHNGIIENYMELRERLAAEGHVLQTETDTEALVHLIEDELASCGRGGTATTLGDAVHAALASVRGVHALAVVSSAEPDRVVVTTNGPPMLVGLGDGLNLAASDVAPILAHARRVIALEEGDVAVVTRTSVEIRDATAAIVQRPEREVDWDPIQAEKGGHAHFMLKEIHEQSRMLEEALVGQVHPDGVVSLPDANLDEATARGLNRVLLLGCGTSWHAALVGRYLLETIAGLHCDVEIASEFRYRHPLLVQGTLAVAITQSGETADTVAAMKEARSRGARLLAVCNVLGSHATRLADGVLHTRAGPEIGVASTKAFTAQLLGLALLAMRLGQARGTLSSERSLALAEALRVLPRIMEEALAREPEVRALAQAIGSFDHALFLGRGLLYPMALEGALKLKEISYVHAEGYPAGEMKHGPIALVDREMPVVGLCLASSTYEKMLGNVQEVKARDGILVAVVTDGDARIARFADHVISVPAVDELLAPIVVSVPLQLLAYHVAVGRGCDVDQPRNLAKSVTVE